MTSSDQRLPRRRFTLVELLVVIGIITVLIGILLPALNAARRSANMVVCSSNLRQIGIALQMYGQQYQQRLPSSELGSQTYTVSAYNQIGGQVNVTDGVVIWWQRLMLENLIPGISDSSKSPMICPADQFPYQPFSAFPNEPLLFNSSYSINEFLTCYDPDCAPYATPQDEAYPVANNGFRKVDWPKALIAPHASDTIVAADSYSGVLLEPYDPNTPLNNDTSYAAAYPFPTNYPNQYEWRRHASSSAKYGTCNVLYLDGHVSPVIQGHSSTTNPLIDAPNVINPINGLDWQLGTTVNGAAVLQTQPY